MSELLTVDPSITALQAPTPEIARRRSDRDEALRRLLGTDYEHAKKIGLIDMFHYDETTGEDGLMHTLSGDLMTGSDGAQIPGGFHHEPSARILHEANHREDGVLQSTRVVREHAADLSPKTRADFQEFPYEPYKAHVVIDNMAKLTSFNTDDGSTAFIEAKNSMYPKEYDPMAVLQGIRIARDHIDPASIRETGQDSIRADGYVPMLDGRTEMRIRLVMDKQSGKILSAYPNSRAGSMKLSESEVAHHLFASQVERVS